MKSRYMAFVIILAAILMSFQNCSDVSFSDQAMSTKTGDGDLTPLVDTVGVVTILLALGDQLNAQLVVNGGSSQLIAETMVRYSSPKNNPKILVVRDRGHSGETVYDTEYIADVLLARYDATSIEEPVGGLQPADVEGYDLIWFNNPGFPMSQLRSKETLVGFSGGIILSGDDMSRGTNFSLQDLTGLKFIDNGTEVTCNGSRYQHDNNNGYRFRVGIVPGKLPGANNSLLNFEYGNDIDLTEASPDVEVIAYAKGGPAECVEERPVLVRYER